MRTLAASPLEFPAHDDRALPGLARALDAGALGAELAAAWDNECGPPPAPETGRIFYVRYKPDTSLLLGFRYRRCGSGSIPDEADDRVALDSDGVPERDLIGYARLLPPRRFLEAEASSRAVARKRSGARLFSRPTAGLLFHLFPFDRALVGLRTVARRGPLKRWATAFLPWPESDGRVRGSASTLELLRYKPERRAVFSAELAWENSVRNRIGRHGVFIKSYAPGEGARTWSVMRRLQAAAPIDVLLAAPLGWRTEERLLVQSRVEGVPLLGTGHDPGALVRPGAEVGGALHRIQQVLPPEDFPTPEIGATWGDRALEETDRLALQLDRMGATTAAGHARSLHAGLLRRRPASLPPTLIHGDFYHHQILVRDGRIGIVDFDEATCDDPRIDTGTFVAHLDLELLRNADRESSCRAIEELSTSFVAAYAAAGSAVTGLTWFRAAALARLALVPFRNLRPGWPSLTDRVLRRALEVLE